MKPQHRQIFFAIDLSYNQYLDYYQGLASNVQVRAFDGRLVRLPAVRLKPFLTHNGIHGRFVLTMDQNNKFVSLKPFA